MIKAIKAVRNKEMGYLAAAKLYNEPRFTLREYVRSNGILFKPPSQTWGVSSFFSSS
jgi:hypothetical protein